MQTPSGVLTGQARAQDAEQGRTGERGLEQKAGQWTGQKDAGAGRGLLAGQYTRVGKWNVVKVRNSETLEVADGESGCRCG